MSHIDRYAPSPTAELHLGNLRTALAGWLLARANGGQWRMRIEDLDTARITAAGDAGTRQLHDLARLGLDFDGPLMRQSERLDIYHQVVAGLEDRSYRCFCTRREIAEASSAPHGDSYRPYPGTCAKLSSQQANQRALTRPAALRIRADQASFTVWDRFAGYVTGEVDDFVLVRTDGVFAYNLAVVVDDIAQGVTHITRGADLLTSAPRQAWLTSVLGSAPASYAHVGLVVNNAGKRLAKRDGAVTLTDLNAAGVSTATVLSRLAASLGLPARAGLSELIECVQQQVPPTFSQSFQWPD